MSLGCAKNLVDAEVLMKQLEAGGVEVVFDPAETTGLDAAIVNTCGFIGDAKQESIDTILEFVGARNAGKVGQVYVMGCLSQRYAESLRGEIPEVDGFFGVNDLAKIVEKLGGIYRENLVGERHVTTPSHYAYLKIAEGCNRKCSFCAIPGIRGKHVSRTIESIVAEADGLARAGVKELNVISQDTTYYGLDLYRRRRLPELLERLAGIDGLEWIRLHYTYPDGFPKDLTRVIAGNPKICRYVDIPLQHISDRILKSMHRGMDGRSTRALVEKIRREIPGVALRTTLIAGYPGETEAEFRELRAFIEEYRFERLGVFAYSHEEGTGAYRLKDSVSWSRKQERVEELMSLQENISHSLNITRVGTVLKVLTDRQEGDYFVARTEYDSPEVDNEVLIHPGRRKIRPGHFYDVQVTHAESFDLFARLL